MHANCPAPSAGLKSTGCGLHLQVGNRPTMRNLLPGLEITAPGKTASSLFHHEAPVSSSHPKQPPSQAFDDVLAKMMQAEVNEGGPPPPAPCDTPVEVISHIHMADPDRSAPEAADTLPITKQEFEQTLTKHLDRLRDEIREIQTRSVTLKEATIAKWGQAMDDLNAKQKVAREKFAELAKSTGDAWERLRHGTQHAWEELEQAVRKARSKF